MKANAAAPVLLILLAKGVVFLGGHWPKRRGLHTGDDQVWIHFPYAQRQRARTGDVLPQKNMLRPVSLAPLARPAAGPPGRKLDPEGRRD